MPSVSLPDFVEISSGIMNFLPGNIFNYTNISPANIAQSGLLPKGDGSSGNPIGKISIMQGTMPVAANLVTYPTSDVLIEFSANLNHFLVYSQVNPSIISSLYSPALAAGTATWFLWTVTEGSNILHQIIGTVGLDDTYDLTISDVNIVVDRPYRILNIRLLFQSLWQAPAVIPMTDYYFSFDSSTGGNAAFPSTLLWPGTSAGWNQETELAQFGDRGAFVQYVLYGSNWLLPSVMRLSNKWTMEFSMHKGGGFLYDPPSNFPIFAVNASNTFGFEIGISPQDINGNPVRLYFKSFTTGVYHYFSPVTYVWRRLAISVDLAANTIALYLNGIAYTNISWSGNASDILGILPPQITWDITGYLVDEAVGYNYMDELRLSHATISELYPGSIPGVSYTPLTTPFPIPE